MEQLTEFVSKSFASTDRLSMVQQQSPLPQTSSMSLLHSAHHHLLSSAPAPAVVSSPGISFAFPSTAFSTAMVGFGHLSFLGLAPSSSSSASHLVRNFPHQMTSASPPESGERSCSQGSSSHSEKDEPDDDEIKPVTTCVTSKLTKSTSESLNPNENTPVPSNASSSSVSSNKSNTPNSITSNSNNVNVKNSTQVTSSSSSHESSLNHTSTEHPVERQRLKLHQQTPPLPLVVAAGESI